MDACVAIRHPSPNAQPQHALAYYRSADGGRRWQSSLFPGYAVEDTGPASELACTMHADPSMAFDRHGRLFYAARCPVFVGLGTIDFHIAVATFDRDGSRFARAVRVDPTPLPAQESLRSMDKVNLAVDIRGTRHDGNVYVAYLECAGPGTRGPCANENESVIHVVRSRRAAADLDRTLYRRRKDVLGRAARRQVPDVRLRPVPGRSGRRAELRRRPVWQR